MYIWISLYCETEIFHFENFYNPVPYVFPSATKQQKLTAWGYVQFALLTHWLFATCSTHSEHHDTRAVSPTLCQALHSTLAYALHPLPYYSHQSELELEHDDHWALSECSRERVNTYIYHSVLGRQVSTTWALTRDINCTIFVWKLLHWPLEVYIIVHGQLLGSGCLSI